MRCPSCSAAAPDDARFCPACAAPLRAGADATRTSLPRAAWAPSEDGARFAAGTLFGDRYRIVGLLGRGGMGEVYRADDLRLGRTVALKFLPAAMERDPGRLVRFLNEVRTALRVTHPNVCRVHDIGDAAGRRYLSMEYVDGEDLSTLLRRIGRLPEERAIQAARQLCAGLAAAHAQGVLHRDLKPANVMIDGRGEVKITDFGLAGAAGGFEGDEIRAGTPAYMAPEQADGREVTVKSDIYALGLVLYELFSGKPAFQGRTREEIARRRATPPTSLSSVVSGLDPTVARVVERCLASDPAERPGSALAVSAALPGGDPLAAALAAGETPSPELVAQAGASGGLEPRFAVPLFAWILLAIALGVPLSRETVLASRVVLDRPPAVLADKARDVIQSAGWGGASVDHNFAFAPNWPLVEHVRSGPPAAGRWDALGQTYPPGALFAYRESPAPLARFSAASVGDWMEDPPFTLPGMVEVWLDTSGRLLSFQAVPPTRDADVAASGGSGDTAAVDWSALFTAAALDPSTFVEVDPSHRPFTFADRRYAWKGSYPGAPDVEILVEGASVGGRPVSFFVMEPWDLARDAVPDTRGFWAKTASILGTTVFVVVVVGAVLVAVRNVRLGRADHKNALRFGLYLSAIRMLWMLDAHHLPSGEEMELIRGHMAYALHRVGLAYVFYLALEPYARRLWPEMLVSWVRIFGGRLRDPRVGRDLLIGVAFGCAMALIGALGGWIPLRFGLPDYGLSDELWSWEALRGPGSALAALAALHVDAVLGNFNAIMLFLVLRIVTRRTWIAVALASLLAVVMFNPGSGTPWPYVTTFAVIAALVWVVLFRAGLLAVLVGFSVNSVLSSLRMTSELTAWHALPMWLAIGAVTWVAGWAFYVSLAGRPLLRDEIQEAQPARG